LNYQWQFNQTNIADATNSSFTLPDAQTSSQGAYSVVVSNAFGTTNSSSATLTVNPSGPSIVIPPQSQSVYSGNNASFQLTAAGSEPLAYQWRFVGAGIAGATNAVCALTNVPLGAAGLYQCVVSNAYNSVTSAPAMLTVLRSTPTFNTSASGSRLGADGFVIRLDGLSGFGNLVIYSSGNLTDWTPILTNPPAFGSFRFLDPAATNRPASFYKAVEQ
jgi:hypothetical protein